MFLETYESNEIFMAYLKELLNTKPNLFIELFLKIDKNYSG